MPSVNKITDFPRKLTHTSGVMTLDKTRLLVCLKTPTDIESIPSLLQGTGLTLEMSHYGGGGSAHRPREIVNHTSDRYWVRSQEGSPIAGAVFITLNKKSWKARLKWFAPVYRLPEINGRRGCVAPLPHLVVAAARKIRFACGNNPVEVQAKLAKFELDEINEQPPELDDQQENGFRAYAVKTKGMTAYSLCERIQKSQEQWGPATHLALMPLLNPLAAFPTDPPNDPQYDSGSQWNLDRINVRPAWKITRGNNNIVVALIDEGCDFQHPDLQKAMLTNRGATFDDASRVPGEFGNSPGSQTHGTECAGIIAAEINNNACIAGMADECPILPIRLITKTAIALANAIYYAIAQGAKVISISLANSCYKADEVREALQAAANKQIVVCSASGNENAPSLNYPAAYSDVVIACGASNYNDTRCSRSDWGEDFGSNYGDGLSVVAPGNEIVTTGHDDGRSGGRYLSNFAGTSAATPHVAGLAAMILSVKGTLGPDKVRAVIEKTARKVQGPYDWKDPYENGTPQDTRVYPNGPWHQQIGYGVIDAGAALTMAQNQ